MLQPHSVRGRVILTTVVIAALGVVACEMPTETEREIGQRVSVASKIDVEGLHEAHNSWTFEFEVSEEDINAMREFPGVDEIKVMRSMEDGKLHQEFVLWGDEIDNEKLRHFIKKCTVDADVEVSRLTHTVTENWISKIGREFLHMDLDYDLSDEELKSQILEQLAAQGMEGSEVHVLETDGDHRAFFISTEPDDGTNQAKDHGAITIELKKDDN